LLVLISSFSSLRVGRVFIIAVFKVVVVLSGLLNNSFILFASFLSGGGDSLVKGGDFLVEVADFSNDFL
jgi:hypothetical protein